MSAELEPAAPLNWKGGLTRASTQQSAHAHSNGIISCLVHPGNSSPASSALGMLETAPAPNTVLQG